MKDIIFSREVKVLINGVRSYGIEHCVNKNAEHILSDASAKETFVIEVHRGFFIAQRNAISMLQRILKEKKILCIELKQARRARNREKENEINGSIKKVKYQEMVVRKAMDAIAWQLFGFDLTILRRLYHGQELIDITDSNIDSELKYIEKYLNDNVNGFVLINDLTSCIQVGDVVTFTPQKGIQIGELKEGKVNYKIFQIIKNLKKIDCPWYLVNEMAKLDEKGQEQFQRDMKQLDRSLQTVKTIQDGEGIDFFTGLSVKIDKDEIELESFTNTVKWLLKKCTKEGVAFSVVEECLLTIVCREEKCQDANEIIGAWIHHSTGTKMLSVDLRQGMFDPLGYPLFLQPFEDNFILDIIQGKKIVKMIIDIEAWMNTFENEKIKWRWMSEKETARVNSKLKGKNKIFTLDKKGIEIKNEHGKKQYIGEGIFSRMFTALNTSSAMKKLLITVLNKEN